VLRASRYDTVLRVTRYVAIRAPVLTILLSLPNYHITTYWMMLGYTTTAVIMTKMALVTDGLSIQLLLL
jgi:hypothetical protein